MRFDHAISENLIRTWHEPQRCSLIIPYPWLIIVFVICNKQARNSLKDPFTSNQDRISSNLMFKSSFQQRPRLPTSADKVRTVHLYVNFD